MLSKILTPAQDELLKEERRILARLRVALSRFDAAAEHQAALDRSIEQLDELFLLVVDRRVQRRQERLHQRAARQPGGGRKG